MKESLPLQFLLLSLALLTPAWAAKTPHQQVLLSQSQHVELAAALDETAEKAAQAAEEEVEQQVKELDAEGEVEKDLSKDTNEEDTVTSRQRQNAHSAQPAEEYNEVGIQSSLTPVAVPVVSVASEGAAPPVDQERKKKAAKAAAIMAEALKKKGKKEEAELAAVVGKSYDMTEAAKAMTEKIAGVKHVVSFGAADKKSAVPDALKAGAASMTKLAEQATNPRAGHASTSAYWDRHAKELGAKKHVRPVNKIVKAAVHTQPKDAAKTTAHSQSQQKLETWQQTDRNYVNPKLPHLAAPKIVAATEDEASEPHLGAPNMLAATEDEASEPHLAAPKMVAANEDEASESTLSVITDSARKFFDHAIADIVSFAVEFPKGGSVSEKGVASVAGPENGADAAAAQEPVGEPLIPKLEDEKTGKSAVSVAVPEKPSEDAVGIANPPAPNSVKSIHTKTHLGSDSISSHAAHAAKQTVAKASAQKDVNQRLQANSVAMKHESHAKAAVSQKNISQAAAHMWDAAKRGKIIDVAKTADPQLATIDKLAGEHSAEHELDEIDAKAEANLTAIGGRDQVALQLSRRKHRLSQNAGDAATGKDIKGKIGAQKPGINDLTNFAAKLSQERKKKRKATDGKATANTKAKGDKKSLDAPVHSKKAIADASQKLSTEDHPVHQKKAVADAKVKASTQHKRVAPPVKKDEKAAAKTETNAWKRHHFARAPRYGSDEMTGDWGQEYASVRLSDKEMNQYYMRKMHHRKLEADANDDDDDDDDDDSTHSGSRRNTFAGIFGLGLATVVACL